MVERVADRRVSAKCLKALSCSQEFVGLTHHCIMN